MAYCQGHIYNDSDLRDCVASDAGSPKLSDVAVATNLSDENKTESSTNSDCHSQHTNSGYNSATGDRFFSLLVLYV